jgi:hypothetical protein
MPSGHGWYLVGPLIAVGLVGLLAAVFWRMGLHGTFVGEESREEAADGLAIFGEPDDYGLLCPVAVTDDPDVADDIRQLLGDAGIRATQAVDPDGRMAVLVFIEEAELARRALKN